MDAIAFGLAVAAIVYIVWWSIKNDNVSSIREQRGLLRMIDHEAEEAKKQKKTRLGPPTA